MGAFGSNINEAIREGVADQGFWREYDLFNLVRGHTGLLLTLSTTPLLVLSSDVTSIKWSSSSSVAAYVKTRISDRLAFQASKAAATINIPFPRFKVNGLFKMSGATDTPRVTVTAQLRAAGGAIKSTFTPTSIDGTTTLTDGTCAALANDTNPALRTWNFFETYGTGPVYAAPGDYIDLKIVPGTHTTDDVQMHGLWLQVAENIRSTDPSVAQ